MQTRKKIFAILDHYSYIPRQTKSFPRLKKKSLYLEFDGSITCMILSPGVLLIQLLACHRYTRLWSFCLFSCSFSGSASYFHLFLKEVTSAHCNICLLSPNRPSFPVLNLASLVLLWMSLSLYFPLDASSYFQEEPTNSVSLLPAILILCHLLLWNITFHFLCSSTCLFLVPIEPFYSFFVFWLLIVTDAYLSMNIGDRRIICVPDLQTSYHSMPSCAL